MAEQVRKKRVLRFSVAAMLFLMLCLGGYLGGYRVGFNRGTQDAANATIFVRTYPVADLLTPKNPAATASPDFDELIDVIVATVSPKDWMEKGTGDGEIQPFPSNMSLVVAQNQANHQAIADLLEGLRKSQASIAINPVKSEPNTKAGVRN
jgi:hypothetical protein